MRSVGKRVVTGNVQAGGSSCFQKKQKRRSVVDYSGRSDWFCAPFALLSFIHWQEQKLTFSIHLCPESELQHARGGR